MMKWIVVSVRGKLNPKICMGGREQASADNEKTSFSFACWDWGSTKKMLLFCGQDEIGK